MRRRYLETKKKEMKELFNRGKSGKGNSYKESVISGEGRMVRNIGEGPRREDKGISRGNEGERANKRM